MLNSCPFREARALDPKPAGLTTSPIEFRAFFVLQVVLFKTKNKNRSGIAVVVFGTTVKFCSEFGKLIESSKIPQQI